MPKLGNSMVFLVLTASLLSAPAAFGLQDADRCYSLLQTRPGDAVAVRVWQGRAVVAADWNNLEACAAKLRTEVARVEREIRENADQYTIRLSENAARAIEQGVAARFAPP